MAKPTVDLHVHAIVPAALVEMQQAQPEYGPVFINTLTHDPLSLELLGRRIGWDHVVLGSDYPFDIGSGRPDSRSQSGGDAQRRRPRRGAVRQRRSFPPAVAGRVIAT